MDKIKLLLVEDNIEFQFIVKESLNLTGRYEVRAANNGKEGLNIWESFKPDVIVADIIMPEMDGLEMVTEIRKKDKRVRIILATAKKEQEDIYEGFEYEIDNYLTKPYTPHILDKYIQALFRNITKSMEEHPYKMGSYIFDKKMRQLSWKNEIVKLTPLEANVLWNFINHKGELVERSQILEEFWPKSDDYEARSLNVVVSKLRKKLSKEPAIQIITIHYEGYKIVFD